MSVFWTEPPRSTYSGGDITKDFRDAQQRVEKALRPLGADVPEPMPGESFIDFRCRGFNAAKVYSPAMKNVTPPREDSALRPLEERVYADAAAYVRRPDQPLREVVEQDASGRKISRFYGSVEDCWAPFKTEPKLVTGWRTK